MFSEILRIKPTLDKGDAAKMERDLSQRFGRVAEKFGKGLKLAIKGTILGISLALLNKLLNPIEALENKIQKLLTDSNDLREQADQFGTSTGQLHRLQDVAKNIGVTPDQLKDMMSKYAAAIEKARIELLDPTATPSATTRIVKNFTGQKDLAEGFFTFIQSLKSTGQGPGRDVFFGEREQQRAAQRAITGEKLPDDERQRLITQRLLRHESGLETRQTVERELFGAEQRGAGRRFIEADFPAEFKKLNEPAASRFTRTTEKLANLSDRQTTSQIKNENSDFFAAGSRINGKMIDQITYADKLKADKETRQLESFSDLKKAQITIDRIENKFTDVLVKIDTIIGKLSDLFDTNSYFGSNGTVGKFFKAHPAVKNILFGKNDGSYVD